MPADVVYQVYKLTSSQYQALQGVQGFPDPCLEASARFYLLSMHQMAQTTKEDYSHQHSHVWRHIVLPTTFTSTSTSTSRNKSYAIMVDHARSGLFGGYTVHNHGSDGGTRSAIAVIAMAEGSRRNTHQSQGDYSNMRRSHTGMPVVYPP